MKRLFKRISAFAVALCLALTMLPTMALGATTVASGECGAEGDNITWVLDSDGVLTLTGSGAMAAYSSYENVPWNYYRTSIVSAIIGDGITNLSSLAFNGYTNLTSVHLPDSITSIGSFSFYGCTNLTMTSFPNNVTYIGEYAFNGCTRLALTKLSDKLTYIGEYAFQNCTRLALTSLADGITDLGNQVFSGCTNLALTSLPANLTTIGDRAFYNCSNLALTSFPSGVTDIGSQAFWHCTNMAMTELPFDATKYWDGVANTPFGGTSWKVVTEHYKQNISTGAYVLADTTYELVLTGETATAGTKTYAGYTATSNSNEVLSGTVPVYGISAGEAITLKRYYNANTTTAYKIQHYQQNVTGTGYTLANTENLTGTTDTMVTASARVYTGFHENTSHSSRVASGTIKGNGTLTLKLYYDRNTYNALFNTNGGTSVASQTIRHGGTVTKPTNPTKQGYNFGNWYSNSALTSAYNFSSAVTKNVTLYAGWTARTDTPYKVQHYQQNVTGTGYTLTDTENLTGTTDATVTAQVKIYTGFHENTEHADRLASAAVKPDGSLVLALYYDRDIHSVTYDSNGGSAVETQTGILWGATVTEPEAPTKLGYDFGSWYADEDLTIVYDFSTPITGDITLFARWTPRNDTPYKVEHYLQNVTGTGYTLADTDELTGTTDATITAQAKTYTGFHENTEHADRLASAAVKPDGSLVLALYYDRDIHSVTYDSNGGSAVETQTGILWGTTVTEPEAPARQGYDFGSWYADEDLTIVYDFSTPITGDITLFARWTPRNDTPYKVEHYHQAIAGNSYTLFETDELTGTTDTMVIAQAKTYIGFHENTDHADRIASGNIEPNGSQVLKLFYDRNLYTVSFITNGGTAIDSKTVPYGGMVTDCDTHRQGYDFGGWCQDKALENRVDLSAYTISNDTVLYAVWTPRNDTAYEVRHYQQTVEGNGYILTDTDELIGTTDATVTAQVKTYTGFHENTEHADRLASAAVKPDGSLVLALFYDRDKYTVTFNGGSSSETQTGILWGATVTEPAAPTKQGYDFGGWYADEDLTIIYDFSTPVTGDTTVYARWIPRSGTAYEVRHYQQNVDGAGYTLADTENLTGTTDTMVTASARVYTGFHENTSHADRLASAAVKPDGSLVLALFYDRNKYTVTFDGGSSGEIQQEILWGATFPVPEAPTKQGYDFGGWYQDETLETEFDPATDTITGNTNLYVSWIPRTDTPYKIMHYQQNADGSGYTLTDTDELTGTTDATVTAQAKAYTGFRENAEHADRLATAAVKPDGSLVLALYYDRDTPSSSTFIPTTPIFSTDPRISFEDVKPSDWFYEDVISAVEKGYMEGITESTFAPNAPFTRSAATYAIAQLNNAQLGLIRDITTNYGDVTSAVRYATAITWATNTGVAIGYDTGLFGPEDRITREQFALMLYRQYSDRSEVAWDKTQFRDGGQVSVWAEIAVGWAVANGILEGNDAGQLLPQGTVSRAEAAALLVRIGTLKDEWDRI